MVMDSSKYAVIGIHKPTSAHQDLVDLSVCLSTILCFTSGLPVCVPYPGPPWHVTLWWAGQMLPSAPTHPCVVGAAVLARAGGKVVLIAAFRREAFAAQPSVLRARGCVLRGEAGWRKAPIPTQKDIAMPSIRPPAAPCIDTHTHTLSALDSGCSYITLHIPTGLLQMQPESSGLQQGSTYSTTNDLPFWEASRQNKNKNTSNSHT